MMVWNFQLVPITPDSPLSFRTLDMSLSPHQGTSRTFWASTETLYLLVFTPHMGCVQWGDYPASISEMSLQKPSPAFLPDAHLETLSPGPSLSLLTPGPSCCWGWFYCCSKGEIWRNFLEWLSMGCMARPPGFKSHLCNLRAMWP